jgi:hypothetical protein
VEYIRPRQILSRLDTRAVPFRHGFVEYTHKEFGKLPFNFKIPPERVTWAD